VYLSAKQAAETSGNRVRARRFDASQLRPRRSGVPALWWAPAPHRAHRAGRGDRAHSAPSAAADRGADTAAGAGAVPRRSSGRPERSRRAPLFVARSFDEDTGGSAFDPCAWPVPASADSPEVRPVVVRRVPPGDSLLDTLAEPAIISPVPGRLCLGGAAPPNDANAVW